MKKWISLAVTLGIMGLIFWFSSQPGTQSAAISGQVAGHVQQGAAQWIVPGWFSANLQANVRKWAHVYIYCALGASMMVTVRQFVAGATRRSQVGLAVLACLLYAASDELHQYFVPGRAMLLTDVGVDAMGFVPGIAAACLVGWLLARRRH